MPRMTYATRQAAIAYWRRHIDAWKVSGLSQVNYCLKEGIVFKNFSNWRGKLKREDAAEKAPRWTQYTGSVGHGRSGSARPTVVIERAAPGIEVELRDGRKVRFDRDMDPQTIRRVLDAIEVAKGELAQNSCDWPAAGLVDTYLS